MFQPSPDSNVSSENEDGLGGKFSPEKKEGKFPSPQKTNKSRVDPQKSGNSNVKKL